MNVTIPATQVKQLREMTDAGMMECKRALEEASGDIELAFQNMRKSGQAKAAKKSGRVAAEGVIVAAISPDRKRGVMLEINSETEFSARDANLNQFARELADIALSHQSQNIDTLLQVVHQGQTVEQMRADLVGKIGENVQLGRVIYLETAGFLAHYIHGGRIGVLVDLSVNHDELGKDIAMHIAATNPSAVAPADVSPDLIAKETEIFTAQAIASGKPKEIAEKMVAGRIKKYLEEVSLLEQPFVKDPNLSVKKLLEKSQATINRFTRFAVGEGMEKETPEQKAEKFKAEVMAQAKLNDE